MMAVAVSAALVSVDRVAARPLIQSSEDSYASVCLNGTDTAMRLIEICRLALDQPGPTPAQRVEMRDTLGYAFYETDRYDEARDVFRQIVRVAPDAHHGWNGLGWVAFSHQNYAAAEGYFSDALDRAVNAEALAGLTASQWELGKIDIDTAVISFDTAVAIAPEFNWARRQKGWTLIEALRFGKAQAVFEPILEQDPDDINARAGLVRALIRQDAYEDALLQTDRALSDTPDSYWFLSQRANILLHMDRYRLSRREADRLIALDPHASEGYVRRARALVALGEASTALSELAEAEARIGRDDYLTYWRARLHFDQDEAGRALQILNRTTRTTRADIYDLKLLAQIHLEREDLTAARRAVDRAKALRSDDPFTLYYDAVIVLRQTLDGGGGVTEAMARFDKAIFAGLPKDMIGDFAGELYRAGYLAHAVAIRAKYPD
ncbi:MAG: tetratricopeptide repeat protein [Pseudomonadota bacterium]